MKTTLSSIFLLLILILPLIGKSQYVAISGKISSLNGGSSLENVNVYEALSMIGTITNKYGFYKLILKKGEVDLLITLDGYKKYTQTMKIENDTTLNIKLLPLEDIKVKTKTEDEIQASGNVENKKLSRNPLK